MKTVTVEVGKRHIQKGECGDPKTCAVALGVGEALGIKEKMQYTVRVTSTSLIVDGYEPLELPVKARKFIEKFDNTGDKAADLVGLDYDKGTTVKKYEAALKKLKAKLKPFSFRIKLTPSPEGSEYNW